MNPTPILIDDNVRFALEMLLLLLGSMTLIIFKRISDDIRVMATSVEKLNINMAVVLKEMGNHDERITRLEQNR